MRSAKRLEGLPIIACGKRIGTVRRAVLSPDMKRLDGLAVDCGLLGMRFVPEKLVDVLGEVTVIASGRGIRKNVGGGAGMRRALTTDGLRIGAICNAWIDEETREVRELTVTQGYIDDVTKGRLSVREFQVNALSGDVVVAISPDTKGGLRHAGRNHAGDRCGHDAGHRRGGGGNHEQKPNRAQDGQDRSNERPPFYDQGG